MDTHSLHLVSAALIVVAWASQAVVMATSEDENTLRFDIYIESACPDTQRFMLNHVYPTWRAMNGSGVFRIDFHSYGKASERYRKGQWIYSCQHGQNECRGNIVQTCAISTFDDWNLELQYIHCMFNSNVYPAWAGKTCAEKLGQNWEDIQCCATSRWGNILQYEVGAETKALVPRMTYIPWIVMNGQHSSDIQRRAERSFKKFVCDSYKGPVHPACQ